MKTTIFEIFRALVVGAVLPAILINFTVSMAPQKADGQQTLPTLQQATLPSVMQPIYSEPFIEEREVWISVIIDEVAREMELEQYIFGVVLGEVPSDFELEALKAQAVVARTYAMKASRDANRHKSGAVCTKSSCCQAYRDPENYLASGGTEGGLQKVWDAVQATRGQVLIYDGELIAATYFSCSGGATEDAMAVWGYDIPYLKSVESPGEEETAGYARMTTMSAAEFRNKMAVRLSGEPETWFGKVTYTAGGGVASIEIGGVEYRGTTIRSLLKLRSILFTIKVEGDNIIISTKGYGHRVGLSQYGADAMALSGSDYKEILTHYYTGAALARIDDVSDGYITFVETEQ